MQSVKNWKKKEKTVEKSGQSNNLYVAQLVFLKKERKPQFLWSNNRQYGGSIMGRRGESIFRRKDGRREARYSLGKDVTTGKTKYRSVYGNTYTEAKEKRTQANAESIYLS